MEVMTDSSTTVEDSHEVRVAEDRAITLIDHAIRECAGRDIVSAAEMTDLLLDIRLAYMAVAKTE